MAVLFILGCGNENFSSERSENLMRTYVTLKATGKNSKIVVDESLKKIFEFVENVKVDVKNLNDGAGNGNFVKISLAVFEVLKISQKYSAETDGAFDITIGAAVDLWKVAPKNLFPCKKKLTP